jgi:mono/diheme cytochrome c family protein
LAAAPTRQSCSRFANRALEQRQRTLNKLPKNAIIITIALSGLSAWSGVLEAQSGGCTVWDGLYSVEQAARGKALYGDKCAVCHGAELSGNEMAPALAGPTFLDNWSSQSLGELAGRIHNTMPLSDPGSLRNRQVADIVAYVLAVNEFPAGNNELPPEPMVLQQFVIAPEKPAQSACSMATTQH